MNKDKLRNIISKKCNGDNVLSGQLYQMYFFEHILDRLSKSKYKNNIILKGGLLLSSIIGDDIRTTKDMDATIKGCPLDLENVENIINEIINIELDDDICFEIINIKDIRKEDIYGGYKINILAKMSSLKVYIAIELTTGDKITPKEIEYNYKSHFEKRKIPILAYTLETVIAEKFQTIISRGVFNTRMKDFYDLYILINKNKDLINFDNLIDAIYNTFKHRNTMLNIKNIVEQIKFMKENSNLMNSWLNYQKTFPYSKNIKYIDLYEPLNYIVNILDNNINE